MQKYYQWLVGGNGGYTRQPCMKIHQHNTEPYRQALKAIGIETNDNDEEFYFGKMNYRKIQRGDINIKRIAEL